MAISDECICLVSMLLIGGVTAMIIWFYKVRPKIMRQKGTDTYVNQREYRPSGDYRRQYWWKRPFLRYPYSFRRPFDYWRPVFYEQQPLSVYETDLDNGSCKEMEELTKGTARINTPELGSNWTIALDMKFYSAMTEDDQLLLRVGQAYPSPMLVYSPIENTLTMILYTHFDGYLRRIIDLHDIDNGQWNNIIWVQEGQWMTVYINGQRKLRVNVGSIPKISTGSLYLGSHLYVKFKNVKVCDYSWKTKDIQEYLEGKAKKRLKN